MSRRPLLQRLDPSSVLVFRALHLGDMLCAIPALRALRRSLPRARIALAIQLYGSGDAILRERTMLLPYPGTGAEPARLLDLMAQLGAEPAGDHLEFPLTRPDEAELAASGIGKDLVPGEAGQHPSRCAQAGWMLAGLAVRRGRRPHRGRIRPAARADRLGRGSGPHGRGGVPHAPQAGRCRRAKLDRGHGRPAARRAPAAVQ